MASYLRSGSKGSTRLHMDMADAVNVMTYAAPTPDGKPGSAAWDLFRAEDSDKIREFLRNKYKGTYQHDPIHSQQFYLDTTLRLELWQQFGIKSYRVYQKPGEAVFIPAGCAHQVRPCSQLQIIVWPYNLHAGCKLGRLRESRSRLCQSGEYTAMREPDEGVPGTESVDGMEGGRLAVADNDVVRMAFLRHPRERYGLTAGVQLENGNISGIF